MKKKKKTAKAIADEILKFTEELKYNWSNRDERQLLYSEAIAYYLKALVEKK